MESMTGFGRAETAGNEFSVTVEAKSLNNRSLSVSLKLPEVFSSMEPEVRKTIGGMFERGRIRLDAAIELSGDGGSRVSVNMETARLFVDAAELLSRDHECVCRISAGELLSLPGVLERTEPSMLDREELMKAFEASISLALTELRENRCREGASLAPLFLEGFTNIREMTAPVLEQQKETAAEKYERLRKRIADLLDDKELNEDIVGSIINSLKDAGKRRFTVNQQFHPITFQ